MQSPSRHLTNYIKCCLMLSTTERAHAKHKSCKVCANVPFELESMRATMRTR